MTMLFGAFLLTLLVITAIGVVRSRNLFAAVMLLGIFSLQIAAVFFILDAADVALTEAAVGAGVATVLMLGALALIVDKQSLHERLNLFALALVTVVALLIIYATLDMPGLGDPNAPVHQHVAPWYLSETPQQIDIPNVVTAILASFRGYDTLGELFVILTAGIGVLFILANGGRRDESPMVATPEAYGLRHHLVPRVVGKLLVPFVVLFGLYVQFHGEYGPGGGFQAGALVSAGLILYALIEGERAALNVLSFPALAMMTSIGAMLYAGVGVACMLAGGNFLDYSVLASDPIVGQHAGIIIIELGVGLTVTGVLLTVFHAFAARQRPS